MPEGVSMPERSAVRSSDGILSLYGRLDGRSVGGDFMSLIH